MVLHDRRPPLFAIYQIRHKHHRPARLSFKYIDNKQIEITRPSDPAFYTGRFLKDFIYQEFNRFDG